MLQKRGELSRITSEKLLEAAQAYIDLLTAHSAAAVARMSRDVVKDYLDTVERMAAGEPAYSPHRFAFGQELENQEQQARKMEANARNASAKLVYLLDLDPCIELVPVDQQLVPFDLIDPHALTEELVSRALAVGPGIREMEEMLALIEESQQKAKGPAKYLPTFGLRMAEGGFGAGPGDDWTWDNRWDLGLQARWNLTELCTLQSRRHVNAARMNQVHLSYEDLRGKLRAQVETSHEMVKSNLDQMPMTQKMIELGTNNLGLNRKRFAQPAVPEQKNPNDVLFAIRNLTAARLAYLFVMHDYDYAQLQLLVLLDAAQDSAHRPAAPCPAGPQLPPTPKAAVHTLPAATE